MDKKFDNFFFIKCEKQLVNMLHFPETYGEDPFLCGELAAIFVKCLQRDNPTYIQANAGCTHFDVHGGPENIPVSRFSFDAKVRDND